MVAEVGSTIGATSATSLWFGEGGTQLLQAHVWNIDPDALVEYAARSTMTVRNVRTPPEPRVSITTSWIGTSLASRGSFLAKSGPT